MDEIVQERVAKLMSDPIWDFVRGWNYPARINSLITDTGAVTFLVTFPDFPEALTEGTSPEIAEDEARDALATVVIGYKNRQRKLPPPHEAEDGMISVPLKPLLAARSMLAYAMSEQGITPADLAGRLGRYEKEVHSALHPNGGCIETLFESLRAVGAVAAGNLDRS